MINYVNVFQGTRGCTVPKNETLYSKWNLLKGKAGNTSPSACLPFGNVCCSPYSGGYSSGYGNFTVNGWEIPNTFFDGDKLIGFSHFTHSGSGAFGFYYNYLVTTPFKGGFADIFNLKSIDKEVANPGYYSCVFKKDAVFGEVTVCDKVAIHRYTSIDKEPFKVAIEVSNDGLKQLWNKRVFAYSKQSSVYVKDGNVLGYVTMQGVKLYFCITCNGTPSLFVGEDLITDKRLDLNETKKSFGVCFDVTGDTADVKVGFSFIDEETALQSVLKSPSFDVARSNAKSLWQKRLSTIELKGATDKEMEVFYSNYYHTLTKPCGWLGESFLWDEKEVFYHDFATLWDVYKTQMPLIFTLHPDIGRGIVKTLLNYGKQDGKLFNALMLSANMAIESTQACCLGCYVLYDAYVRGLIDDDQVDDMFSVVRAEIGQYAKEIKDGTFEKTTKLLDCTLIAGAFSQIAKDLDKKDDYIYLNDVYSCWTKAFGDDGLLKVDYPYYEGNHWNYSFRFVLDVQKRIELAGGKDNLIGQLDKFFAFSDDNELLDRFEGFNNETDMETPYFYHYVGRYDRLITIIKECVNSCYTTGPNGLPGNNDSGGLSCCYIWNFLGLFPISGQDAMFIGYPAVKEAVLHLSNNKDLTIKSNVKDGKVKKVTFNGKVLDTYKIQINELLNGGELVFS